MSAASHGAQQIAGRVGLGGGALGQRDAELPLQAGEELDTRQAIESEIGIKTAVQGNGQQAGPGRVRFGDEIADDLKEFCRVARGARLLASVTHTALELYHSLSGIDPLVRRRLYGATVIGCSVGVLRLGHFVG